MEVGKLNNFSHFGLIWFHNVPIPNLTVRVKAANETQSPHRISVVPLMYSSPIKEQSTMRLVSLCNNNQVIS
jgi:hypothetical protein